MLWSCQSDPTAGGGAPDDDASVPASLSLDIATSRFSIASEVTRTGEPDDTYYRSVFDYDDPLWGLDNPDPKGLNDMAEFASLVAGWRMYHLTVFLLDIPANRVVAYRNIYKGSPDLSDRNGFLNEDGEVDTSLTTGDRVRVTFDYDKPKHGEIERLHRGRYMILAVANHSDTSLPGYAQIPADYDGLPGFTTLVDEKVIARFDPEKGIGTFNPEYAFFYNYLLKLPLDDDGTQPYIRPLVAQALTTSDEIALDAGVNTHSLKMRRPVTRLRIEVQNYSELPLTINSLSLSNNFSQSCSFLFPRADWKRNYTEEITQDGDEPVDKVPVAEYYHGKGAPDVTHANAIIPFDAAKWGSGDDNRENEIWSADAAGDHANKGRVVIFDGLMYESYDEVNPFTYTLGVEYKWKDTAQSVPLDDYAVIYSLDNKGEALTTVDEIDKYLLENDAERAFLIKSVRYVGSYLYAPNDGRVMAPKDNYLTLDEIMERSNSRRSRNYYWYLTKDDDSGKYWIRNVGTGEYLGQLASANSETALTTVFSATEANLYEFQYDTGYAGFRISNAAANGVTGSLNMRGDRVGSWDGFDLGSVFAVYPLASEKQGLKSEQTITLTTIDSETSAVSQVTEIARNDFIRVLVGVSYNPDSGDFEFYVVDWNTGGYDDVIEFH